MHPQVRAIGCSRQGLCNARPRMSDASRPGRHAQHLRPLAMMNDSNTAFRNTLPIAGIHA
jgi:hypothetical protein